MNKNLAYYRRLPYPRRCQLRVEDGERYWLVWAEGLPGCKTQGDTKDEAYLHLQELFDDYITALLESGSEIPEPERTGIVLSKAKIAKLPKPDIQRITQPADVSIGIDIWRDPKKLQTAVA